MSADEEARFRVLFEEHFASLWRFARRRVVSSADADDITAEILAVAWRRHHDLPGGDDTRLWLFGVARHVLANQRRSERRRRRLHLRLVSNTADHVPGPGAGPGPDDDHASDAGTRLPAALAGLSDADRDLLVMRYWDVLAVHEIATLLGCTPNAVSLRLHKAKGRLTKLLAEKDPVGAGQVAGDPSARRDRRHA